MVKRKRVCIGNVEDCKDGNGLWVKSYNPEPYVNYITRAAILWSGINKRCKVGGSEQARNPTYIGCTNGFKDFQEFAEWANAQYGYLHKEENGKFWQLDKDLKVFVNKEYSKDTCIFVPHRVNALLTASNATRGEFPIGVSWNIKNKKFQSRCKDGCGKNKHLGYFDCALLAHQAWQQAKINLIRRVVVEDEEIRNHLELVPILLAQAQRIEDDLNNGRETM